MRPISNTQLAIGSFRYRLLLIANCLLLIANGLLLSCSIPNLDPSECIQSRDTVKEFYSWYLASDVEQRSKSPEMFEKFIARGGPPQPTGNVDPYVLTSDFPKAFRVGECKVVQPDRRTQFEVLLFWKDDVRSEQRSIKVDTENVDGKWLIRSVTQ